MGSMKDQHKLIRVFMDAVSRNESIDSSNAHLSDDDSMVTYAVAKHYNPEDLSINLKAFTNAFKKRYGSYNLVSTGKYGFAFVIDHGQFQLNYGVDIYPDDGSLSIEVVTSGPEDQLEDEVKNMADLVLIEFAEFQKLLYIDNN